MPTGRARHGVAYFTVLSIPAWGRWGVGACCPVCTDVCTDMACKQVCDEHEAHLISWTFFHYTWLWDTLKMKYHLCTGMPYLPFHPASSQESPAWGLSPYLGMAMCTTVIIQVSEELAFHDLKKLWCWAFYIRYTLSKIGPKFSSCGMLLLLMHYILLVKFSAPLWIKPVKNCSEDNLQSALPV